MKTIRIALEAPEVDLEDVEDFLATDDLFVDYFNTFLALPSFPEPLCFNKDTGGFEVVSDAKKELARQIKAAIRSQKRTPRIYRVVKKHSYIDIPLIPIENPNGPDNVEINTSFTVTTLNKEQGIHWVKAERLPAFLESDLYLEYRLSKLMSQARITGEHGEYVLMRIDFKPRVKKVKKKQEEEEVEVDPKEAMMKDMYVCMGNASTTETEAWYTTARQAQQVETTYSASMSRPGSATTRPTVSIRPLSSRPLSARPASAYSDQYFRSDSGMGMSLKSAARTGSFGTMYQSRTSVADNDDEVMMSKLFSGEGKTGTARRADNICVVNKEHGARTRPYSATVYAYPKSEPGPDDADSDIVQDVEDKDESRDSGKGDDGDDAIMDLNDSIDSGSSVVFKHIDDIGAVIVGTVLKRVIASLTGRQDRDVQEDPEIASIYPDQKYSSLTVEALEKMSLCLEEDAEEHKDPDNVQLVSEVVQRRKGEESDVDSLLDSEEDYEEADTFFRKHKSKTYSLATRRGLDEFKKFLKGTLGEKNWTLWIDIDRMRLMTQEELPQYLVALRERYHLPGGLMELSVEQKLSLGLVEPSSWTQHKLLSLQNQIVEPLILYWAPRFMLKQLLKTNPNRNILYQHQQLLKPIVTCADPNPPTVPLLPLRPKSCHPRVRTEVRPPPPPQPSSYDDDFCQPVETSPPVGLKRTYTQPTLQFIANWQREHLSPKTLISSRLTVAKTSTPRIRSPVSGKSSSSPIPTPRARSARPSSVKSTSSNVSVESATGRIRIKSAAASRPKSAKPQPKTPVDLLDFGGKKAGGKPSSRRSSVASSIASDASSSRSVYSEFIGGRRMETLLQALFHEADAGGFFRRYIERSGKMVWLYNLNFWRDLQEYHQLFYQQTIDAYIVHRKAKTIYSQYIVTGASHHIRCSLEVAEAIYHRLDPPFEDLFDGAEEHVISTLHEAWHQMIELDQKTYSKVELIDVKRRLETKSKYVLNLQKRGLIKDTVTTPDEPMEGYEDPVYDEALIQSIPEEFKDYTLEKLVHNRIELEHFRNFLSDNYASMDILCWMDIEAFRRIPHTEDKKRDTKAKEIKTKYLNKKYFFGANSPAGKEGQEKVVEAGGGWGKLLEDRPPNPMILEAQKYVQDRLEKKWLPLFLVTPEFAVRQKPRTSMDDVVDDVLVQKRKRSQAVIKFLESKWVSSSKEIMIFRKALLNPVTNLQFRRFVSVKGEKLENDVLFWLEVQKFKDLYHAHCEDALILQKVGTIINCFIDSQIPPSLQIDTLPEIAEKIIDRKYERSPYLFREAQLMVFKVLFTHWNDFCEFRSNLAEEKIMPLLERRRKHAKAKERAKQQEVEEKQAREAERRAALGLPPLGEEDDVFHDPFQSRDAESADGELENEEVKDKISWSYSNYISALEKEELLNNTDETSFSSLMTDMDSVKGSTLSLQDKDSNSSKLSEENRTPKSEGDNKKKPAAVQNGKKADAQEKGAVKKQGGSKEDGSRSGSAEVTRKDSVVSSGLSSKQDPSSALKQKSASPGQPRAKLKVKFP